MKSTLSILTEIAATASTNAKQAIIKREEKNPALRATFAAAYDPTVSYYVKKIPAYLTKGSGELLEAIKSLDRLAKRQLTGQAGIDHLQSVLESVDRKSTRLNSSHSQQSRMPSSA